MDIPKFKDAVSHISASDEYKKKTIQMMAQHAAHPAEVSGFPADAKSGKLHTEIRHRWPARSLALAASLTAALAMIVVTGVFLLNRPYSADSTAKIAFSAADESTAGSPEVFQDMAADTGTEEMLDTSLGVSAQTKTGAAEGLAGCSASYFADMNYALLEIDGTAYYLKGDGRLFLYLPAGTDEELMTLPVDPTGNAFSDGTYFYYSLGSRIFQFSLENPSPQVTLEQDRAITLDYIDQDRIIFHDTIPDNLEYNYTVFDRKSGESRLILQNTAALAADSLAGTAASTGTPDPAASSDSADVSPEGSSDVYLSLLDVSGDTAVFNVSGYTWSAMYCVSLTSLAETKLFDQTVLCARIIDDTVYFAPDIYAEDSSYNETPALWSVLVSGDNLSEVDLSSISFNSITWITRSGSELLIAVSNTDESGSCVYLYQPDSGHISLLRDGLGSILNFFATDHFFSLFSQDPSGAGNDITVTETIVR